MFCVSCPLSASPSDLPLLVWYFTCLCRQLVDGSNHCDPTPVTPQSVPPAAPLARPFRSPWHTCQVCENKNTQQTAALLTASRHQFNQSCRTSARGRPQSTSTPVHPSFHQWLMLLWSQTTWFLSGTFVRLQCSNTTRRTLLRKQQPREEQRGEWKEGVQTSVSNR